MAFNQTRAGEHPNSLTGRAADEVAKHSNPTSAVGRAAENKAEREEFKHGDNLNLGNRAGFNETGRTGMTGTGLGARGIHDEQAFNQSRTGEHPNSLTGRAADEVAKHSNPTSAVGRAAENKAEREEFKHGDKPNLGNRVGLNEHGRTGVAGTGLGARGIHDEQLMGGRNEMGGRSEAYCPNPNTPGLAKEYETRVNVIERVPEMKTVTKTDYIKQVEEVQETVMRPKTRIVMEEKERVDMVPQVREIEKTRTETRHRVVEEQVEIPYTVKEVVNIPVPRKETVPRLVTEQVEETVTVPVVKEVPVQRQVEVPTGKYCEQPINQYQHAGKGLPTGLHGEKLHTDHKLLNKEVGHDRSTPTNDDGLTTKTHTGFGATTGTTTATGLGHKTGTTATTGTGLGHNTHTTTTETDAHQKPSLFQKIEHKLGFGHKH